MIPPARRAVLKVGVACYNIRCCCGDEIPELAAAHCHAYSRCALEVHRTWHVYHGEEKALPRAWVLNYTRTLETPTTAAATSMPRPRAGPCGCAAAPRGRGARAAPARTARSARAERAAAPPTRPAQPEAAAHGGAQAAAQRVDVAAITQRTPPATATDRFPPRLLHIQRATVRVSGAAHAPCRRRHPWSRAAHAGARCAAQDDQTVQSAQWFAFIDIGIVKLRLIGCPSGTAAASAALVLAASRNTLRPLVLRWASVAWQLRPYPGNFGVWVLPEGGGTTGSAVPGRV